MTASPSLTLLQAGTSPRLAPLLDRALEGIPCRRLSAAHLEELTPGDHLLFAVGMDAFGPGREFTPWCAGCASTRRLWLAAPPGWWWTAPESSTPSRRPRPW